MAAPKNTPLTAPSGHEPSPRCDRQSQEMPRRTGSLGPRISSERKQRPAGHDRLALGMFDIGPGETPGVMLAPATVGLLLVDEPSGRAREDRIVAINPRGAQ